MSCNRSTKSKNDHVQDMNDMFKKWIEHPNIKRMYKNSDGSTNWKRAEERFKDFAQYKLNLPWDVDYTLTAPQLRRIGTEIDAYAKDLRGEWGNILGIVPEGISKQDPISRKFYLDLNDILNKERVNVGTRESAMADVTSHLLNAYVNAGQQGKYYALGIKTVNKLRDYRKEAMTTDDANIRTKFEGEIDKLLTSDEGVFLNQFKQLSGMNKIEFDNLTKNPSSVFYTETVGSNKDKQINYDTRVLRAAQASRSYLSEMGGVFINGLKKLKSVIDLKYGRHNQDHAQRIKDDIDIAINGIKKGDKEGGYWPGLFMQNLVDIKTNLDKTLPSKKLMI